MATQALIKQQTSRVSLNKMSLEVAEVRRNINLIQEAMKATMKKDVHYGIIPGCGKPSLYKPGAEVIIALFKLSTDPIITNLSENGEIRYQVKVNISTREGVFVGSGIGECSSGEEKYSWRSAICQEEFDATPEHLRRIKFKKYQNNVSQVPQVRVSPSDMANTILKMAKKRALIDAVLTSTAASDIFSQDIEELPEGYIPEPNDAPVNNHQPVNAPTPATTENHSPSHSPKEAVNSPVNAVLPQDMASFDVGQVIPAVIGTLESFDTKKFKKKDQSEGTLTKYVLKEGGFIKKWGESNFNAGDQLLFINVKVEEFKGEKQFQAEKIDPVIK